ncbi:MAG: hypothetical protein PHV39_00615 [Methanomicrobium sp.]|nr:hypothetical protein [Methanomicrobium sp.]
MRIKKTIPVTNCPSNNIKLKIFILLSFVICSGLFCSSASAENTVKIDPIPDQVIWTEYIQINGNYPDSGETRVYMDFHSVECFDENKEITQNRPGTKEAWNSLKPDSGEKWWSALSLNDLPPGDYIFRAWVMGYEDNKTIKFAHVSYISADAAKIVLTDTLFTNKSSETGLPKNSGFYAQNSYTTPGSGMNLTLSPDLSLSEGEITKGESLSISGSVPAGNSLFVLVCRHIDPDNFIYKKIITPETDDKGNILESILLSSEETKELLAAKYYIYAISGTEDDLSKIKERICQINPHYSFLKNYEDKTPYQQFVMLLKEPWIRFDNCEDGALADVVAGENIIISGTTNLKTGTILTISIKSTVRPEINDALSKDIEVAGGEEENTWSAEILPDKSGTGEFRVTAEDKSGTAYASATFNIFDITYFVDNLENDSLLVQSYNVDPVSKKMVNSNETAKKSPLPVWIIPIGIAGGLFVSRRIRRKRNKSI